ncbi:hypothetical protein GCM10022280_27640 [Sphingomonas swuensis]|uniref:Uncharacterized protein n=1 Tax=Sphingomonas swuensis TaxID=977800 RepID=A0ABP7TEU6_9SPHN
MRAPVLRTDGNPDAPRNVVRQLVVGEGGDEADHALRYQLGYFNKRLVHAKRAISELVQSAAKTDD